MSVYARVYMIKIHTVMVKPVACGCPEDRLHFTMKIAVDSNPWNKLLGHRTTSPTPSSMDHRMLAPTNLGDLGGRWATALTLYIGKFGAHDVLYHFPLFNYIDVPC